MYLRANEYKKDVLAAAQQELNWETFRGKKVLIVGATGMIGTTLIDILCSARQMNGMEFDIYAMGRNEERARRRFADIWDDPYFHFVSGDINQGLFMEERVDYIFHCASNTHPKAYANDPIGTITTNIIGTDNILRYAAVNAVERVVFLSSVEIYGENRGDTQRFTEEYCGYIDCNTLRAGYPESKRAGEALCQAYLEKYGVDVVIPRVCRVYGPTMLESDSKALAQFIRNAVNGQDIVLKSEGKQYFSYCYVVDAAMALLYLLLRGEKGRAYNIASEASDIHLRELAQILAEIAGTRVVFDLPDAVESKGFSRATTALLDSSNLQQLGWRAQTDIQNGLRKTVEALREER